MPSGSLASETPSRARRWETWRATFVLIAGALTLLAVLLFKVAPPPTEFTPVHREWAMLTREPANGWALSLIPACLLVACGVVMLKHARPPLEPRLSRVALWGAIGPALFFVATLSILVIDLLHTGQLLHDEVLFLVLVFSGVAAAIAVTILGAVAIWRIKRSGGKLYGLRLAAVEALLFPLILLFNLVGQAVFWLIFGLVILLSPGHEPFHSPESNIAVVAPLILIALSAAIVVTFFAGRAVWRGIVRKPAAPSVPNTTGWNIH